MTTEQTDLGFMRQCLELAQEAKDAGESAVGSLVVDAEGGVLADGVEFTRRKLDPSAHAELEAIKAACLARGSTDLSDCTMYTTVEPCFLCGYVIRATGIRRVVMATDCGEIGAIGGRHPLLMDAGFTKWGPPPEVTAGLLEAEAKALREG